MSVAVTTEGRPLAFEVSGGGDSRADLTLNIWKATDLFLFFDGRTLVKVNFWDSTFAAAPFLLNIVIAAFVILGC